MNNTLYTGEQFEAFEACMSAASEFLNVEIGELYSHPDFYIVEKEKSKKSLGVNEATEVLSRAALKPVLATKTVIVIKDLDYMTEEGQNRLLKTLEDKNYYVLILASAENAGNVLDTVKSRMVPVECHKLSKNDFIERFNGKENVKMLYWLTNGYPARLKYIESVLETFEKIAVALDKDDKPQILKSMGLMKEKDSGPFDGNIEMVKCFLRFLEGYKEDMLINKYIPSNDREKVIDTVKCLELIRAEREKISASYSKNDLFAFVRNVLL